MSSRRLLAAGVAVAVLLVGAAAWAVEHRSGDADPAVPAPTRSDVAYASASAAEKLDLWLPEDTGRPHPLVIFVHGGGFSGGDKRDVGPKVAPLLARGFAVASVNYRLSGEAVFPAAARDVKAAVRHLRARAVPLGIDPDRFAIWGESAGANLAALIGITGARPTMFDDAGLGDPTTSAAVQAVVEWYGPIDFARREAQYRSAPTDCREPQLVEADRYTTGYLGADVERVPAEAAAADPVTYIRPDAAIPPFSVAHGSADCLVPPQQARDLTDALRAAGHRVDLHLLAGAVHADPRFDAELLEPTLGWLDAVLGRAA